MAAFSRLYYIDCNEKGKILMNKPRKPGGRKPIKPDYNSGALLEEQMDFAVQLYEDDDHPSLQTIANQMNTAMTGVSVNPIKVRKLLITAGVYESDMADMVLNTFHSFRSSGLSYKDAITATMEELNLSQVSVSSYLPYEKGVYFPKETNSDNLSLGSERIHKIRKREKALEELRIEQSEEALWAAVIAFQDYKFRTYSGLPFSYKLKKGRSGAYTKELFIERRENSKSLAWSSVVLAFRKTLEMKENAELCGSAELCDAEQKPLIDRPKAIGDIRGVTYIYALFYRFGLIDVPEEAKEKMEPVKKKAER